MVCCSLFQIMKARISWIRIILQILYISREKNIQVCSGHLPPTNYWKSNKNVCYKNVYRACERRASFHSQNIQSIYFKMRQSVSISSDELWTIKLCKTEYYDTAEVCHWQQTGEETKIPVLKILYRISKTEMCCQQRDFQPLCLRQLYYYSKWATHTLHSSELTEDLQNEPQAQESRPIIKCLLMKELFSFIKKALESHACPDMEQ